MLSEINVTPFVDVMLVLLVIFMVTAPMMQRGVEVDLPKTSAKPILVRENRVVLTITREKRIFINGDEVELNRLRERLKTIYLRRTDKELFLKGDKTVHYGFVVEVMAEIRKAGVERLGMITELKEERD